MHLSDGRTKMSTRTDNHDIAMDPHAELAHRALDGIEVLLLWDRNDGRLRVVVDDVRSGDSFEFAASDGKQALDAFYHPFAYAAVGGIRYRTPGRPGGESVAAEAAASASSLR